MAPHDKTRGSGRNETETEKVRHRADLLRYILRARWPGTKRPYLLSVILIVFEKLSPVSLPVMVTVAM